MRAEKLIRADAKLKNLPEEDLQTLWRLRHPEEGGEVITLEAIAVYIKRELGISIALSSLSSFYVWLDVRRRMEAQANLAEQLKYELSKNPDISDEVIKRAGQKLFMSQGILEKDAKIFADMVIIGQNDVKLRQNDQKIGLQKKVVSQNERKLALLEAAAAAAKAKLMAITENAKSQGGITPETLARIEEAAGLL